MFMKKPTPQVANTDWTTPDRTMGHFRLPATPEYDRRTANAKMPSAKPPGRIPVDLPDGITLVCSDAHWWPGYTTPAEKAFIQFARFLQPEVIIMNGDAFDGAGISRFGELAWQSRDKVPTVADQLEATRESLRDIEFAAPKARRIWTLGNHDARFEKFLIDRAPEYANVVGVSLKDHFAGWEPGWSAEINGTVMIKHRYRGGIHAPYNNVVKSGRTIVTGHLHSLQVRPFTDYNGTRWGVDSGTLADPNGPQFEYTEDNPKDWRMGFVVLTFRGGRLLWPETVWVRQDGIVEFRGEELS